MKVNTNCTILGPGSTPANDTTAPIEVKAYPEGEPHSGWKRDELEAYAVVMGIENPQGEANKADLLSLIELAGEG